jgi:hypothetical protein
MLFLALAICHASPAMALTAELAKKCDAAALQAFPNQRVGTSVGTTQRNKFRRDCIEKNGNIPAVDPAAATAPVTPSAPAAKSK